MKSLIRKIEKVKKSEKKKEIDKKLREFKKIRIEGNKNKIFSELCFCILTANWQAEKSITIQKEIEKEFINSRKEKLRKILKIKKHRFWPQRAERVVMARRYKERIYNLIKEEKDEKVIRNWIAENIMGLGMKESSHFLRNIGYTNVAIVDFHIIDLLVKEKLIQEPKTITEKKYLEIENLLRGLSEKVNLSLGELDLYLWYIETGKILK